MANILSNHWLTYDNFISSNDANKVTIESIKSDIVTYTYRGKTNSVNLSAFIETVVKYSLYITNPSALKIYFDDTNTKSSVNSSVQSFSSETCFSYWKAGKYSEYFELEYNVFAPHVAKIKSDIEALISEGLFEKHDTYNDERRKVGKTSGWLQAYHVVAMRAPDKKLVFGFLTKVSGVLVLFVYIPQGVYQASDKIYTPVFLPHDMIPTIVLGGSDVVYMPYFFSNWKNCGNIHLEFSNIRTSKLNGIFEGCNAVMANPSVLSDSYHKGDSLGGTFKGGCF